MEIVHNRMYGQWRKKSKEKFIALSACFKNQRDIGLGMAQGVKHLLGKYKGLSSNQYHQKPPEMFH
jgi:hypothetical protein